MTNLKRENRLVAGMLIFLVNASLVLLLTHVYIIYIIVPYYLVLLNIKQP